MENFLDALANYLSCAAVVKEAESNGEYPRGFWLMNMYDEREKLLTVCKDSFVALIKGLS